MPATSLNIKPNIEMSASIECEARREVSTFPGKLFQILEQASDDSSLWWTQSGSCFCVLPKKFDRKEAVENFQGTQFSSIMRRLFRYGFDRVAIREGCKEFPAGALLFENQFFRKGRPDLLKLIKIDNKRLYRKAIQRDEPSCPLVDPLLKAPPSPVISSSSHSAKLDLLLRMEHLRRENEREKMQAAQVALEKQCFQKALLLARLRAMNQATALTRPLSFPPRLVPSAQPSSKSIANELLLRGLFPGPRYF